MKFAAQSHNVEEVQRGKWKQNRNKRKYHSAKKKRVNLILKVEKTQINFFLQDDLVNFSHINLFNAQSRDNQALKN